MPSLQDQKAVSGPTAEGCGILDSIHQARWFVLFSVDYYIGDLALALGICHQANDELVKRQSVLFSRHELTLFILSVISVIIPIWDIYIIARRRTEKKG